jgi:uncharacterized heparinase superfamily protein
MLKRAELERLFHTVRHLEAVQVLDRLRRRLAPLRAIPEAGGAYALVARPPALPAAPRDGGFDGRSFRFLNRRVPFEGPGRWEPAAADRLWTYQLHCFRFVHGLDAADASRLMLDWVAANRNPRGTGWEPYTLSLRIREWIEWLAAHPDVGEDARETLVRSLAEQAGALLAQIEYHLLGNHLLENGITLAWAGLSLGGPQAGRWLRAGARILDRELARQILPDGTHDERSPMYQALIADALGRLARVAAAADGALAADVHARAGRAAGRLAASLAMQVHPDGDYALLNDCALGEAPRPGDLAAITRPPAAAGPPEDAGDAWSLPDAGYFGLRSAGGTYLVFDAGPLGPDHQPGHGHADALSFELSHRGRRLVADTGVCTYTPGELRAHDRGTAAHNTIEIDGRDQSEVWGAFRCGRRIDVVEGGVEGGGRRVNLVGAYAGPGLAPGGVRHRRALAFDGNGLAGRDTVAARGRHRAALRIHLAPGLQARRTVEGVTILDGWAHIARLASGGLEWRIGASPYHPEFGLEQTRVCLEASFDFTDRAEVAWELHLR